MKLFPPNVFELCHDTPYYLLPPTFHLGLTSVMEVILNVLLDNVQAGYCMH